MAASAAAETAERNPARECASGGQSGEYGENNDDCKRAEKDFTVCPFVVIQ
jgi:hypothetical protein